MCGGSGGVVGGMDGEGKERGERGEGEGRTAVTGDVAWGLGCRINLWLDQVVNRLVRRHSETISGFRRQDANEAS